MWRTDLGARVSSNGGLVYGFRSYHALKIAQGTYDGMLDVGDTIWGLVDGWFAYIRGIMPNPETQFRKQTSGGHRGRFEHLVL